MKGLFIVFEGLDGSGKTTQAGNLARYLQAQGCKVVSVEEPGGTPLGERIREILLDGRSCLEPLAELLLYEASRHQLTRRVIRPALEGGAIVICQRYSYSSLAYQGYGRGLPLEWIEELSLWATEGLKPDLVFLLDVPAEEGLRRLKGLRSPDRMEMEGLEFLRRVELGYRIICQRSPEMIRLDGMQEPEKLFEEIVQAVEREREGKEGGPGGIHCGS